MIVELRTNSENPALSLSEFRGVGEQVYAARIRVVSGSFQAELRLGFDFDYLIDFIKDLRRMDREMVGKARLKEMQTAEPYLAFELTRRGAVEVSGVLLDFTHRLQRMTFLFTTDQTVLAPFADDLEKALALQIATQTDEV